MKTIRWEMFVFDSEWQIYFNQAENVCLLSGSGVRRSCGRRTRKPELQRRHRPSSSATPSVSPSARPSWNACSCPSFWTAACRPTPPFPPRPSPSHSPPPPRLQTLSTRRPTGHWGTCGSNLRRRHGLRPHWRRRLKSFPKTRAHTSGLRSDLALLNHRPPGPCHLNRCLCWHQSLTFSPDRRLMKNGIARWDRICELHTYVRLHLN